MPQFLSRTWRWSRRYITLPLIVAVVYIVFVLFFNDNSYFKSVEYQQEIDRLEAEIKANNDTMQYYHRLNSSLSTDPRELERIVREQYHMQRPDEDVYIFEN
ncbi:MAG: septum formation initiator family protein [Bacteroidales bacterium]|nr:septum formation initiator family protein [Bacteroidales bacterium]